MSAPRGVAWLAGEHATFEEVLTAGREVRAAAVVAGARLPPKDLSRLYPSTMQDAVAVVHARLEENKKKAAQSKQKTKSKSGAPQLPSDSHFPGARAGGGDPSAFWLYIEDYFRDFTREDLRALLPLLQDPREDPALKVPTCGRRLEDEQQQQRRYAQAKAAAEAARAAATRGGSEWDSGAVDSRPSGSGGMDGSPEAERRSSRLVSRHCKEEELRRQEQLEAQAAAAATAAEAAEAAATAAAARAMAVVPTTAHGAPAKQLLDVLPDERLALLLQQLSELQRLAGLGPLSAAGNKPVQAALAQLQAAAAGSNGGLSELDLNPASRAHLHDWLRQHLAALSERLGCSLCVLPPWAQRLEQASREVAARKNGVDKAGGGGVFAGTGAAAVVAGSEQQGGQEVQSGDDSGDGGGAAELAAAKLATAAYVHPYVELMLRHKVQQHTVQQAVDVLAPEVVAASRQPTMGQEAAAAAAADGGEVGGGGGLGATQGEAGATPGTSLLTATPAPAALLAEVPSVASLPALAEEEEQQQQDKQLGAADDGETGGAGGGADVAAAGQGGGSPAVARTAEGSALDAAGAAGAATPAGAASLAAAREGEGPPGFATTGGAAPSRAGGRARGVSNYALLAGKKSSSRGTAGPPKKAPRPAAPKPEPEAGTQHPVARAVAALVAAGEVEGLAAEQWRGGVGRCSGLLAAAPEDEVLAELLALQNELMQQSAINRTRLLPALAGVVGEAEGRRAAADQRAAEEEEVKSWILKVREFKRQQHRQRREQAHAEALAAKKQSIMASPRPVLGRQPGSYQAEQEGGEEGREGSPALQYALGPNELYDVLAQRQPHQEAFCAVCGEGHSEAPNQIVFCERCDVAVHQHCYSIPVVPEGEWLCEPCREYEQGLKAQGKPPAAIRPPNWQSQGKAPPEGGSRSCRCPLCPIKYGAFKKSEDGRHWVHSACALWIPETFIGQREVPGVGRQEFVGGMDKIKPERWEGRCAICGGTDGAVVACQQPGGCPTAFHVLCARNIGLYTAVRPDPTRKFGLQHRIYCALHGEAQRVRDDKLKQERREKAAAQQQKESKARAAERAAAAKQALAAQEAERYSMHLLRANLETCRMLTDVTKRRERLKKQVLVLLQQQWGHLRHMDPEAALTWLQQAQQQRQQAEAEAAAAAAAEQQQQQQPCTPLVTTTVAGGVMVTAVPVAPHEQTQMQQMPPFTLPPPLPMLPQQQAQQAPAMPLPPLPQQQQQQQVQQPSQPQQAQQQQQQQQVAPPQLLSSAALAAGLPQIQMGAPAGATAGLPFLPPHLHQQAHQAMLPLSGAGAGAQMHSQALAPPSFALDMFGPQHPQHFFMHHQQQLQQQHFQQQMQAQQQRQQRQQMQQSAQAAQAAAAAAAAAAASAPAAAFPGLPLPLPPQPLALQQVQQPQGQQQGQGGGQLPDLPAATGLLVNVPPSGAAAARVPAEVAAAMFGAPSTTAAAGMMPSMPSMHMHLTQQAQVQAVQQAHLAGLDPAVAAMLQGQPNMLLQPGAAACMPPPVATAAAASGREPSPSPRHPARSAATAAATGDAAGAEAGAGSAPGEYSPQPSAGATGSGRPKRAATAVAAGAGGAKRQRLGSEEPSAAATGGSTPTAAGMSPAATPGPAAAAPGAAHAAAAAGGAAAAAGRRQRVASVKVRENLLQRERQMTAQEAAALNAQLPQILQYMPATDLEAALGSPIARGGGTHGTQRQQAKARGRAAGSGGK